MSTDNEWKELVPPDYPEGDNMYVFCHKCGGKNRQDQGWRYRDDPEQTAKQADLMRKMDPLMAMLAASSLAKLTYQCAYCRDDKVVVEEEVKRGFNCFGFLCCCKST